MGVVSGSTYIVNPLDKTCMMNWLTQTVPFPGFARTVVALIFQR